MYEEEREWALSQLKEAKLAAIEEARNLLNMKDAAAIAAFNAARKSLVYLT